MKESYIEDLAPLAIKDELFWKHHVFVNPTPERTQKDNWLSRRIAASHNHQNTLYDSGINETVLIGRDGKTVFVKDGEKLVEFVSCSYLGLDSDPRLSKAAIDAIRHWSGIQLPFARTRLLPDLQLELESLLEQVFSGGKPVLLATVGLCHLGILPLLGAGELPSFPIAVAGPEFLLDKTAHASLQIQRDLMGHFGPVVRLDFNDADRLRDAFRQAAQQGRSPIAVCDSVGSMGGLTDLKLLTELAEQHGGYLYLDDAHGTSIHGRHGGGYVPQFYGERHHPRALYTASFAKAFGVGGGAIVLPSAADVKCIKRFANTYIFGGPIQIPILAALIASAKIHLSPDLPRLQEQLWKNVAVFDATAGAIALNRGLPSPVRGFRTGSEDQTLRTARFLREHGFAVTAALYPTVALGQGILRCGVSALHTVEQIQGLCRLVEDSVVRS